MVPPRSQMRRGLRRAGGTGTRRNGTASAVTLRPEPMNPPSMLETRQMPAWPVALLCAAIPVVAVHVAWYLSTRHGYVEPCIPYFDGCASISRVARHGAGNLVFKALMIPCALLQGWHWLLARRWIVRAAGDARLGSTLVVLGAVAALALVVYASALGSEGVLYRFMRRYGITFYFASTYVAQLVFLRALAQRVAPRAAALAPHVRWLAAVCVAMLALGLASVAVSGTVTDPDTKDRLENLLEWHLGVLLTAWFVLEARAMRNAPL